MFRYKLRTLLVVLALGPPMIWGGWLVRQELTRRAWERRLEEAADIGLNDWLTVLRLMRESGY